VLTIAVVVLFLNTVYRLRARLYDAERRAALQSWHMKQLFPATLRKADASRTGELPAAEPPARS
jgi:hypothetical protein